MVGYLNKGPLPPYHGRTRKAEACRTCLVPFPDSLVSSGQVVHLLARLLPQVVLM